MKKKNLSILTSQFDDVTVKTIYCYVIIYVIILFPLWISALRSIQKLKGVSGANLSITDLRYFRAMLQLHTLSL